MRFSSEQQIKNQSALLEQGNQEERLVYNTLADYISVRENQKGNKYIWRLIAVYEFLISPEEYQSFSNNYSIETFAALTEH